MLCMKPRFLRNPGKGFVTGTIFFLMFQSCPAEQSKCHWDFRFAFNFICAFDEFIKGVGAVFKNRPQGSGIHLLKTQCQHTFRHTSFNRLTGEKQCGRAGGTVVIDIDYRNSAHSQTINGCLPTGAVPINITGIDLLDLIVGGSRIFQSQADGLFSHFLVGATGARFDEWDHSHSRNEDFMTHFDSSGRLVISTLRFPSMMALKLILCLRQYADKQRMKRMF